jgi:salicylate hydroxylase
MTVLIVGGGIGGLALGRALTIGGHEDFLVLEQAPAITAVGAGIQLTPNASRVIDHLGLTAELTRSAVESQGSVYHDVFTGELVLETAAGGAARERYGYGYYQAHRASLLETLQGSIDPARIRLGSRCVSARADDARVVVELDTGELVTAEALVGADGLNSVVREAVVPDAGPAEFSGVIGCRTLISAERARSLGLDRRQHTWWGPGLRLIAYWVNGGTGLNFLAMVPCASPDPEDWAATAAPANLRRLFRDACSTVTEMVDLVEETFATGVFGHHPLDRIVSGRMALMGDAAHPLPPYLANGAAQALEDAVVLARCVTRTPVDDYADAFARYQELRLGRVTDVQAGSWEMDVLGNLSGPERSHMLQQRTAADPTGGWLRDWLWGYDAVAAADSPTPTRPARPDFGFSDAAGSAR